MKLSIFKCKHCGQMVEVIEKGGGTLVCCGEAMEEQIANTKDAAQEKHVPFIKAHEDNGKLHVQIGEVAHPMLDEHYIQWILVVQGDKIQRVYLKPGSEPEAHFIIDKGAFTVYEYCNIHGLWVKECNS